MMIYRGDYRLRLHRVMCFSDGIRRVITARGEFVGHEQLYCWEVGFSRGPYNGDGRSRSFTVAFVSALWRGWRPTLSPCAR